MLKTILLVLVCTVDPEIESESLTFGSSFTLFISIKERFTIIFLRVEASVHPQSQDEACKNQKKNRCKNHEYLNFTIPNKIKLQFKTKSICSSNLSALSLKGIRH